MLTRALAELGIRADAVCGHSVGEWTAMVTTGVLPEDDVAALIADARTGTLEVPGVVFTALGCGLERAQAALDGLPDIAVSHDNCPHQVIVCGVEASVDEALQRLRSGGVLVQKLPFRSGFHSPLFAPYLDPHRRNLAAMSVRPSDTPLWSGTTCAPFPSDPDEVRALAIRHLVEPVRFRELVLGLHAAGRRVFVQVGPGSLVGFIEDTLRGQPFVAITANAHDRTGMEQLTRVAAALFCAGLSPRFEWLHGGATEPTVRPADTRPRMEVKLALAMPMVERFTVDRPSAQIFLAHVPNAHEFGVAEAATRLHGKTKGVSRILVATR